MTPSPSSAVASAPGCVANDRTAPLRRLVIRAALVLALGASAALGPAGCKKSTNGTPPAPPGNGGTPAPVAPPDGGTAVTLPSYWFETDFDAWVGKPWNAIDLFTFMGTEPRGIRDAKHYVVFYNRTCDHCEEMFNEDLAPHPDLARMVTAVEVPAETDRMTAADAWPMPKTECEMLALPLGVNWIITTPLSLRIEDGVVTCAQEGEHKRCFELE